MRGLIPVTIALVAAVVWVVWWPTTPPAAAAARTTPTTEAAVGPLRPVVAPATLSPGAVALGRKLFHDPRLSADGTLSCASCHDVASGGADGRPHAIGIGGAEGKLNSPTVIGAGMNSALFWDGRAATLEAQVSGPMEAAGEMGSSWGAVLAMIAADPAYVDAFDAEYGGVSRAAVERAISDYERSLAPVGSRFDRYLAGDADALTSTELRGYALFQSYGCASCHQGANVGGNLFQRLGIARDYFAEHPEDMDPSDLGRFNVTGRSEDRHVFRVPALRMVSRTAPYFHDGSAATLDEAIQVMARYQLGREIPADERADIAAFLGSLAGEVTP